MRTSWPRSSGASGCREVEALQRKPHSPHPLLVSPASIMAARPRAMTIGDMAAEIKDPTAPRCQGPQRSGAVTRRL